MNPAGLVATAVFLVALAAFAPLRMALGWFDADAAGLSAGRVEGSVWSGRLHAASFRGVALGDVSAALAPFRGGLRIAADRLGSGVVKFGSGLSLTDVDAQLPLSRLAPGLAFDGDLALEDLRVAFGEGGCRDAAGKVALSAVRVRGVSQPIPGLNLAGAAGCRDGRLVAPLSGAGGGVAIDATLTVDAGGRYELATRIRATDPVALAAISAGGFERGLDGFTRTDRGLVGAAR